MAHSSPEGIILGKGSRLISMSLSISEKPILKIGDHIKYKTSKTSLQTYYGTVLGFKEDKINVSKYKFSDYSGFATETYIDKEDII